VGDREALASGLRRLEQAPRDAAALAARRSSTLASYDWDRIAAQTFAVYESVMPSRRARLRV
jgi:hypothetical protein